MQAHWQHEFSDIAPNKANHFALWLYGKSISILDHAHKADVLHFPCGLPIPQVML
jgi:hypothetical protein